jgi:hypothetical protein
MSQSNNTNQYQSDGSIQSFAGTAPNPGVSDSSSGARLLTAGLVPGASSLLSDVAGKVFNINFQGADGTPLPIEADWRLRVSLSNQLSSKFYNNPIMGPLQNTKGVIFPYTPQLTLTHNARYGSTPLTHSNYNSYFYEGSEVASIQIRGDFTVQNVSEGQYLMAVIQFFRTCTKMFFGNDINAGTPPPMVFLDGYGPSYLPHVPCVVTSFSHDMPPDVDYMQIPIGLPLNRINPGTPLNQNNVGGPTWLPTSSTVTVALQPVYSRTNIANNFTLSKYASGQLTQNPASSIGGFL